MRKRIGVLLICLLCVTSLYAGENLEQGLGVGASMTLNGGLKELSSYSFDAQARLKVMWVDFLLDGSYRKVDQYNRYEVMLAGGFSADFFQRVRLGIQVGPQFRVLTDSSGNAYYLDKENVVTAVDRVLDVFSYSPVDYRLFCDCKVGPTRIGLYYDVETMYRFVNWENIKNLFNLDWGTGKVGVSVMYTVF